MSPSLRARALFIQTVQVGLGSQFIEACKRNNVELTVGDCRNYKKVISKNANIITWGVKIPTWWYIRQGRNVLFLENGMFCQRTGSWIDAGGWFSESNMVKNKDYLESYTEQELNQLKEFVKIHFKWELFQGGDPSGPIMIIIQSLNDATVKYHFPLNRTVRGDVTTTLLNQLHYLPKDKKLLIRPHPRFKHQWFGREKEYSRVLTREFEIDKTPNVYDSIKKCSAVVGVNSTTLSEVTALGLPVATLGESIFTGAKVTLECARKPELLKNIFDWKPSQDSIIKFLTSILRHHQLRYGCSVEDILNNKEFKTWVKHLL